MGVSLKPGDRVRVKDTGQTGQLIDLEETRWRLGLGQTRGEAPRYVYACHVRLDNDPQKKPALYWHIQLEQLR